VKDNGKWFLLVYDEAKEVYRSPDFPSSLWYPLFSPDGRLLVYDYGERNKERTLFFLDLAAGKVIRERTDDFYYPGNLSFSSDSSRVLYYIKKGGKHFLVLIDLGVDEERLVETPYTLSGMSALSPDGKKVAYSANRRGKYFLVESSWESPAKGKESGPYEEVRGVDFIPGSTTTAYYAMKEGRWRIVAGGREGPDYDGVGKDALVFSPDGANVAYSAMKRNGKWVMVVSPSNEPGKAKEGPSYDMVVTPVWSPDGRHLVYRARNGTMKEAERFIVIADPETGKVIKEGPVNDEVWPPVWSADSKAAAYGARQGRELWWRVEAVE
jgi:Tol biopolymer transport system component